MIIGKEEIQAKREEAVHKKQYEINPERRPYTPHKEDLPRDR